MIQSHKIFIIIIYSVFLCMSKQGKPINSGRENERKRYRHCGVNNEWAKETKKNNKEAKKHKKEKPQTDYLRRAKVRTAEK